MLTFEEFLESENNAAKTHYGITKKNKLYSGIWDRKIMTNNYANIDKIFLERTCSNGIELLVEFEQADSYRRYGLYVIVTHTKRVQYDQKEFPEEIISMICNGHKTTVLNLYKKYLKNCILDFIKGNKTFLARCGWLNDSGNRVFLSINWGDDFYPQIRDDLFNGGFQVTYLKESMENTCKTTENFKKLFSLLLSDTCMFTAFSYSIHSILWDYLYYYKKWDFSELPNSDLTIFSLCIYGKNFSVSKILANLLLNFFVISHDRWTSIYRSKYHVSSTSLSRKNINDLFLYNSVPIIITSKSNHYTKDSSIMKKIQQKREQYEWHFYPVYISDFPVHADEIVNICSDSVVGILDQMDSSELHKIHRQFCFILLSFIQYLTEISNHDQHPNRDDDGYLHSNIWTIIDEKKLSKEWVDDHVPELLLYSTVDGFCYFLKHTPLACYRSAMLCFAEHCFINPQVLQSSNPTNTNIDYLNLFYLFIQENVDSPKNKSWIWEDQERLGDKESCYYISAVVGYEKFQNYLKRKSVPVILKGKLVKLLKEKQILKRPASGNSNVMKRKNVYVFILIKEKFDAFYSR